MPAATREEAHAVGAAILGDTGRLPDAVARRESPLNAPYWSKRTFDYFGDSIDRGQVFRFKGGPNDKLMKDLGYAALLEEGTATYACVECGAEFIDQRMRDGHGNARHRAVPFVPPPPPQREHGESSDEYQNRLDEYAKAVGAMADASDDQRDRHENEVAPLDLTKTSASREA